MDAPPAPRARRPARRRSRPPASAACTCSRPTSTGALDEDAAKARGTALHSLLEHLHGRPPATRAALAARLLPDRPDLPALLAEASAVLDAPHLAHVFATGSLAEVAVTAPLDALGGARILGRIDRLIVEPGRILAVDFKSNAAVPAAPEAIPDGILRQIPPTARRSPASGRTAASSSPSSGPAARA